MLIYLGGYQPRDVTTIDFSDLTSVAIVGYPVGDGGDLPSGQHIEFASDLDEWTAQRVRIRALADVNQQALQDRAFTALNVNGQWLNRTTTPNLTQAVSQLDHVTRECTGIIRLLLGLFDTTTGS